MERGCGGIHHDRMTGAAGACGKAGIKAHGADA